MPQKSRKRLFVKLVIFVIAFFWILFQPNNSVQAAVENCGDAAATCTRDGGYDKGSSCTVYNAASQSSYCSRSWYSKYPQCAKDNNYVGSVKCSDGGNHLLEINKYTYDCDGFLNNSSCFSSFTCTDKGTDCGNGCGGTSCGTGKTCSSGSCLKNCDATITCSGSCTATSSNTNTCSTNNGTKGTCKYTTHSVESSCIEVSASDQSCTVNNCSTGYSCYDNNVSKTCCESYVACAPTTSCYTAYTKPNGQCSTDTCSNAPAEGTCSTACGISSYTVSDGACSTKTCSATIPCTVTPAPTVATSCNGATSQMVITWTASAGAADYTLERWDNGAAITAIPNLTVTSLLGTVSGTSRTYTDSTVTGGNSYQYALTAHNSVGYAARSSRSDAKVGTTCETIPPTGTISINNGALATATRNVILSLSCADAGSGCSKMCLSNNNDIVTCSAPAEENYVVSKPWTLSSGDGTKTVYVKYKDVAGNTNLTSYSDDIILYSTSPTPVITSPSCFVFRDPGDTISISWTNNVYFPVTWVDISTDNFVSYYHKAVAANTTNGTGFNGYQGVLGLLTYNPFLRYSVRTYNGYNNSTGALLDSKPSCNNAEYVSRTCPPPTMFTGQIAQVSISMKNTGGVDWTRGNYFLGSKGSSNWGFDRVSLDSFETVIYNPPAIKIFSFPATASNIPGTYTFKWQMVDNYNNWFGDITTPECTVNVTIKPYLKTTGGDVHANQ